MHFYDCSQAISLRRVQSGNFAEEISVRYETEWFILLLAEASYSSLLNHVTDPFPKPYFTTILICIIRLLEPKFYKYCRPLGDL